MGLTPKGKERRADVRFIDASLLKLICKTENHLIGATTRE